MATKNSIDLALFFTQGVSLGMWSEGGMLAREVALYTELSKRGVGVRFVTYGCADDLAYRGQLGDIQISSNQWNLPDKLYHWGLRAMPPKGSVFKSNQVAGADIALAAARRAGAKFIARCGYLLSDFQIRKYGQESAEALAARRLEQQVFTGADAVVVTTQAMTDVVCSDYGINRRRVNIIPNYVETERFAPQPKRNGSQFRIGFVGRLDTQKNVGQLVSAVRDLDVELALVGEGPLKEELEAQAEGATAKVNFIGRVDNADLPAFLNSCDLFVLPSLYEGHPKALLEAMSCGVPVVGTRVSGIAEAIHHGEDGLVCELSVDGIRAAVEQAMEDGRLRQKIGRGARKTIEDGFSLSRIVDMELSLLKQVSV